MGQNVTPVAQVLGLNQKGDTKGTKGKPLKNGCSPNLTQRVQVPPEDGFWGVKRAPSTSLEGTWTLWVRVPLVIPTWAFDLSMASACRPSVLRGKCWGRSQRASGHSHPCPRTWKKPSFRKPSLSDFRKPSNEKLVILGNPRFPDFRCK